MRSFMKITLAAVSIAFVMLPVSQSAIAFEVDGYRSGMTELEALKVHPQAFNRAFSGEKGSILYAAHTPFRMLAFCDGKLTYYQRDFANDWHSFMRGVEQASHAHGPGQYSTSVQDIKDYGENSRLTFGWNLADGSRYEITRSVLTRSDTRLNQSHNYETFLVSSACSKPQAQ